MKDNEIIETWQKIQDILKRTEIVVLQKDAIDDLVRHITNILDLINRLQAELKQYAEEHRNLMAKIEKKDKEIEKWQQVNFDLCTAGGKLLHERKTIKAEAYKEFAEKIEERIAVKILKDKSNEYAEGFVDALDGVNGEIDNLLKEIIGE